MNGTWTEETIVKLINSNTLAVCRGLQVLFGKQESDEQSAHATWHSNQRGFNCCDAKRGSVLAKRLNAGKMISPEDVLRGRKLLYKYRRQLLISAAEKAISTSPVLTALWNDVCSGETRWDACPVLDDALQELGFPEGLGILRYHWRKAEEKK